MIVFIVESLRLGMNISITDFQKKLQTNVKMKMCPKYNNQNLI